MSNKSSYALHGEVAPYIQESTKNNKEVEETNGARRPWDQLPEETTKSYSAFLMYLDMGMHDRSQSGLAKILYGNEKSTGQISKWSVNYDWINRAEAWDRYCANTRKEKMESGVEQAEDIMLTYLPKVAENLSKAAAGEFKVGRSEMRAISDFLDRVGPSKKRRETPQTINNNLTVNAPQLPQEVRADTDDVPEAEVIEEATDNLIPQKLQDKRKNG